MTTRGGDLVFPQLRVRVRPLHGDLLLFLAHDVYHGVTAARVAVPKKDQPNKKDGDEEHGSRSSTDGDEGEGDDDSNSHQGAERKTMAASRGGDSNGAAYTGVQEDKNGVGAALPSSSSPAAAATSSSDGEQPQTPFRASLVCFCTEGLEHACACCSDTLSAVLRSHQQQQQQQELRQQQ